MSTLTERTSNKLVKAFLKNKIIAPLPRRFTKKLTEANKFRMLCESKVKKPIIGYKAGGTGIPVMKKLKEKEPFYASVYKNNFLKSGKSVKINKLTIKNRCTYYGLDGKKYLVVHGDIFDYLMKFKFGRWIMHIGDLAYDFLMYINIYVNSFRRLFNLNYWSLTKYMKIKSKNATNWSLGKFLENFETQMTRYCSRKGYDGIICGHIHNPTINIHSGIVYMNDGDWVDNCSALVEDSSGNWSIIYYDEE